MSEQARIIEELGVAPQIDPEAEILRRSEFMASYLAHTGLKGFVLGISGGQDSLLAGIIAKRAVDIRTLAGHDSEFHALLLPYGLQSDRADAELACHVIQPNVVHDLNIQPTTDTFCTSFLDAERTNLEDFHKGNIKARMRMVAHYTVAGKYELIVVGTDHAAEAVTGFFTKFGDGGADVLPLSGLTKRQGRQMLQALHAPDIFTTKPPTADLLDGKPGQADESELALTYEQIDDYLEGKVVDPAVAANIEARYDQSWHKRNLPVAYKTI